MLCHSIHTMSVTLAVSCQIFDVYSVLIGTGPEPKICCQFDFRRLQGMSCPWNVPPVAITSSNVKERYRYFEYNYQMFVC
jgi:hypothetical protein